MGSFIPGAYDAGVCDVEVIDDAAVTRVAGRGAAAFSALAWPGMSNEEIDLRAPCDHVTEIAVRRVQRPQKGCEDCLKIGGRWVHLRVCLTCGHVGCCDSSPNKHATKHFRATAHPIITSAEVGETWAWCYVDERALSGG